MSTARILVIDDDPNLSRLVKVMLEKTNAYQVAVENRPRFALTAVHEFKPHLILLDVDMPGRDGGQVAREIQSDIESGHVPILFLTALVSKHEAGMKDVVRGGRHFLAKPAEPAVLIGTIEEILAEQAVQQA